METPCSLNPDVLNVWMTNTTTAKGKRNKSKLCERKSFLSMNVFESFQFLKDFLPY